MAKKFRAILALVATMTMASTTSPASAADPYVRPDVKIYLDALAKNPRPPMSDALIGMIRKIPPQQIAQMMAASEVSVGKLAVDKAVSMPGPGGPIGLRLFDARAIRAAGPVVVFYHGGGFVVGSIETHAALAAEMSRQLDLPVVSVDYRLAPEHKWPAASHDAEAAARWIAANGATLGRQFDGLILTGDSAGGTLTLLAGLALRDKPASVPVRLLLPLYPMADASQPYPSKAAFGNGYGLDTVSTSYYDAALGADKNSPRYSALLADLAGLPPVVLVTASLDPLRDGGRAFGAKLVQSGVPVGFYEAAGNIHGFATFRKGIPSAQRDLDRIMALAKAMLSAPTAP